MLGRVLIRRIPRRQFSCLDICCVVPYVVSLLTGTFFFCLYLRGLCACCWGINEGTPGVLALEAAASELVRSTPTDRRNPSSPLFQQRPKYAQPLILVWIRLGLGGMSACCPLLIGRRQTSECSKESEELDKRFFTVTSIKKRNTAQETQSFGISFVDWPSRFAFHVWAVASTGKF